MESDRHSHRLRDGGGKLFLRDRRRTGAVKRHALVTGGRDTAATSRARSSRTTYT